MRSPKFYFLVDNKPVPCDVNTWAKAFDVVVARISINDSTISTVFIGVGPSLFETMVFGGPLDDATRRYQTWEEAEAGHVEMVSRVIHSNLNERKS